MPVWYRYWDGASSRFFYYEPATQVKRWAPPSGLGDVVEDGDAATGAASKTAVAAGGGSANRINPYGTIDLSPYSSASAIASRKEASVTQTPSSSLPRAAAPAAVARRRCVRRRSSAPLCRRLHSAMPADKGRGADDD